MFGTTLLRARERVVMPPPGDTSPARLEVRLEDPFWDVLYAPITGAFDFAAQLLKRLLFLTIRQYLSLVFVSLVGLLLVLAIWP